MSERIINKQSKGQYEICKNAQLQIEMVKYIKQIILWKMDWEKTEPLRSIVER